MRRHVSDRPQMTNLALKLKYLVHLDCLELSDLTGDLHVICLILTIGGVGENLVEVYHRVLECLQLQRLRLDLNE